MASLKGSENVSWRIFLAMNRKRIRRGGLGPQDNSGGRFYNFTHEYVNGCNQGTRRILHHEISPLCKNMKLPTTTVLRAQIHICIVIVTTRCGDTFQIAVLTSFQYAQ